MLTHLDLSEQTYPQKKCSIPAVELYTSKWHQTTQALLFCLFLKNASRKDKYLSACDAYTVTLTQPLCKS